MRRLVFFLFFAWSDLFSQIVNPGVDNIYRPGEIATIRLTLGAADKAFLLDPANDDSDVYKQGLFQMTNSTMDTILVAPVGVRLRGNTSRYAHKKAFKIDFKEFGGKKFFGYKKFNLKANVNDPTQVREPLTMQYFREMGIPAARTHPVKLYMNGEYMGVYINVEQIDDVFLTPRFGQSDGFLYKCAYGANLLDNGQVNDTTLFESELNEDTDNRVGLAHFVHVLNSASDANFQSEIEPVFDVDGFLRYLAVEALVGHWDGYSYNMNNFYLYYNSQTSKIDFIPYDADNTWGIDWLGVDWGSRDIANWANTTQPRPLTTRILHVSSYREKYGTYLTQLINAYFNDNYLNPILDAYQSVLSDAVRTDGYFSADFGFTYNTFVNAFTQSIPNTQVKYGITQYLHIRSLYAITQQEDLITGVEPEAVAAVSQVYPNPSRQPQIFLYASVGTTTLPMVYNTLGVRVAANISVIDDEHVAITLPEQSPAGVYLIRTGRQVLRWVYQRREE
jgi:spore coat protein H